MSTIRRTVSPVPRPGTLLGEVAAVGTPLSKCSSCNQDYSISISNPSLASTTEYTFYRIQNLIRNLFSNRSCKSLEKQKPKASNNIWRRSLFHFFICFLVGVFVGFTPIVSVKTSANLMSKNQAFSFEQVRKVQLDSNQHKIDVKQQNETVTEGKFLIIVTPTYPRMYYLNRLGHTLKLVKPPLLWVVVEMSSQSGETAELLRKSGVMYRHLVCTKNTSDSRVHQRNVALLHIEKHRLDGIVYFADDTNVYSSELFEHMRRIRRFGTWPVAKLKENTRITTIEGPICNNTQVVGWHTNTNNKMRRFHADLAGFAFNSTILWDPMKWERPTLEPIRHLHTLNHELQVSSFIKQVVEDEREMEGIPEDCSKVLVWHLPMESSSQQSSLLANNLDTILPLQISIRHLF